MLVFKLYDLKEKDSSKESPSKGALEGDSLEESSSFFL